MQRTLAGNPRSVMVAALSGALAVVASWKIPGSSWLVLAATMTSGIGWGLVATLAALLIAFYLGWLLEGATGAQWRHMHARLHVRAFWALYRAIAFLLGAVLVLGAASALGHQRAEFPLILATALMLEFCWFMWCAERMADRLREQGHRLQ